MIYRNHFKMMVVFSFLLMTILHDMSIGHHANLSLLIT
jgi:hypothetical protein